MQLSDEEYVRVSHAWLTSHATVTTDFETFTHAQPIVRVIEPRSPKPDTEEMNRAIDAVNQQPDVRESIVASLRSQIEAGNYAVSGDQIAQMMVRRFVGDTLR